MGRPEIRVVVLYEDEAHGKFIRRLLTKLGVRPFRLERCGGCMDLLDRFVIELRGMRARMTFQRNLGLLVLVDADAPTIAGRIRQLDERVFASGTGGPRGATERIAYVVPALEIENWYVHLCVPGARPVREDLDYKPDPVWKALARDLGAAARAAVAAWDVDATRVDPASLAAARPELGRL